MSIPPQAFPLGRPGLKDERRRNLAIQKFSSESDTTKSKFENEERGCARADSEGTLNEVTRLKGKKKVIKH